MTGMVQFDPLLPIWAIAALAALSLAAVTWAWWRDLTGWSLRALAAFVVLAALSGPVLQRENRAALSMLTLATSLMMAPSGPANCQCGAVARFSETKSPGPAIAS